MSEPKWKCIKCVKRQGETSEDLTKIANEQIIISYFGRTKKKAQVVEQKVATLKNRLPLGGQNSQVCSTFCGKSAILNAFQATLYLALNIDSHLILLPVTLTSIKVRRA